MTRIRSLIHTAVLTVPLAIPVAAQSAQGQSVAAAGPSSQSNPFAELIPTGAPISVDNFFFAPGADDGQVAAVERWLQEIGTTANFTVGNGWTDSTGQMLRRRVTWSFAPDNLPGSGGNILFQTLDAGFPGPVGRQTWVQIFEDCFQRWGDVSGIQFERVVFQDDWDDASVLWGQPAHPGRVGDIRIRMRPLVGNTLGFAFAPNTGDITLNSLTNNANESWPSAYVSAGFTHLFPNLIMNMIGMSIGLQTTCPQNGTKLMEPGPSVGLLYGPQHDDIRGAHKIYGDIYEPNDAQGTAPWIQLPTFVNAMDLSEVPFTIGTFGPTTRTGKLSIDGPGDVDTFRFQWDQPVQIAVSLQNVGLSYPDEKSCLPSNLNNTTNSGNQANLWVEFLDRTGAVINSGPTSVGGIVRITGAPVYIRVTTTTTSSFEPQAYKLIMTVVPFNSAGCTVPTQCDDQQWWNGLETCQGGVCTVSYTADCNGNYLEDAWDILNGNSADWNGDGIPDECQEDCNGNGILDAQDIAQGTSVDLDGNGIPDECQGDCNGNGIPDSAELNPQTDTNANGVLDACERTRYVPVQDGVSNSYPTIRAALAVCNQGDTIQLAAGTFRGPDNREFLIDGLTVQFQGAGADKTTIDLQGLGRFAIFASQAGANQSSLRDLRIRNGRSDRSQLGILDHGGALWIYEVPLRIDRCIFDRNYGRQSGGAIFAEGNTPALLIQNSLFFDNASPAGGALNFIGPAAYRVYNCTLTENHAKHDGAALVSWVNVDMHSCIVWNNYTAVGDDIEVTDPQTSQVRYCIMTDADLATWSGNQHVGNFSRDPMFWRPQSDNFRLQPQSPCRDLGHPIVNSFGNPLDLDRLLRVVGPRVDIGAYEFQ